MIPEKLEQILNLFEQCQSRGKPLKLSINEDFVKIYPLPPKLILDLLNEHSLDAICYLSSDQTTLYFQNNLSLCPFDQNQADSCRSTTCRQLHVCQDYILNKTCSQFESDGKCSHSHSLSTKHNQTIMQQYDLSSNDAQIFQFISRLTRLSLPIQSTAKQPKIIVQSVNRQSITDELINEWLGDHKAFLIDQKLINSFTVELIFDDDEVASMMENIIKKDHSLTALVRDHITPDLFISDRPSNMTSTRYDTNTNDNFDQEVQPIKPRIFSNQLRNLDQNTKVSSAHSLPVTFGRGRGRQTSNITPNPPSISRPNPSLPSTGEKKFIFSNRLNSKPNEQIPQSPNSSSSSTPELTNINSNPLLSPSESTPRYVLSRAAQRQNNDSKLRDHYDSSPISPDNQSSEMISSPTQQDSKSKTRFVLRENSLKNKEKTPITTTPRDQTPINYTFKKQFTDEQLCYLLGPGSRHINEGDQCQIIPYLPSGYCQIKNSEQGKEIEKQLYSIVPKNLNIDVVKMNDDLALVVCSSAAENLFQQNQTEYGIISEPTKVQLNIEVIDRLTTDHMRSSPISDRNLQSDGKFHIKTTDSSINVISDDISQVPVDMMICISTSNNLRENVLRCAGATIRSQYKERYCSKDALLLDGGSTKAQKILFVPWETEIDETEIGKTQESLSDLVEWCINEAHKRKVKSISFPPIGTGQLNLDPELACEALIGAASKHLHQYQMDVIFVIYPAGNSIEDDECYQVFRTYLNNLCEQIPATPRTSNERKSTTTTEPKQRMIRRDVQSKRIITLSDLQNINEYHQLLIQSLEKLIHEKTFDLSLVESKLTSQVDLLIDICLSYNIFPHIDYSRQELTLRGDLESCLQCFFNLRHGKLVHQYSYVFTENGQKSEEIQFNSYVSLKIDEAFAVGETNIRIKDNEQLIFDIDLNKLQVRPTKTRRNAFLVKKQIDDSKIRLPSSWSTSLLMICTKEIAKSSYESLECFRAFQQTMSISDWQIDRIESIQNYPLYLHFMQRKSDARNLYFHGCSFGSVRSIIHYGLHSTNASRYGEQFENRSIGSICLTRDALNSHLYGTRRSTDGKHYLFVMELAKYDTNNFLLLSNEDVCLALPTYLIVYQRRQLDLN